MGDCVKFVVFVPTTDAAAVRDALAQAGAGRLGNYDSCSFSTIGIGRFRPCKGAHPARGKVGAVESVEEERIEVLVEKSLLVAVVKAALAAHPYEEPAYEVIPLLTMNPLQG